MDCHGTAALESRRLPKPPPSGTFAPTKRVGRARHRRPARFRERDVMKQWIRFEKSGRVGFGTMAAGTVAIHDGDMFAGAKPTGETVQLADVRVLTPCEPSKMICLWNNFHQLAAKNDFLVPDEPLYFLKAPNAYHQ